MAFQYKYKEAEFDLMTGGQIYIEYYKNQGDFVYKGELLAKFTSKAGDEKKEALHYCEEEGYLHSLFNLSVYNGTLLYLLFKTKEERFRSLFKMKIGIGRDEFSNSRLIEFQYVPDINGISTCYTSIDFGSFHFAFKSSNSKSSIVFGFSDRTNLLKKNDKVTFLFSDSTMIDFVMVNNPVKLDKNHFMNQIEISNSQLEKFEKEDIFKWKLTYHNSFKEIISSAKCYRAVSNYDTADIVKYYTKLFRQALLDETPPV